ncbi:U-box domain-containing protein 15 [Hibiscus syriacus]|uniref:RING-type E3 ubiquitin transferase n=1 Tax=Hibiscus syriacus TaxID=106335 RepID=A0A6A2WTS1_HIBSY|nr:U-box domain-containing protein 15-like [Hibiscus syriacus]KAE8658915.1 U-box domain-containing protein 15 [Hibiscus syriacus]
MISPLLQNQPPDDKPTVTVPTCPAKKLARTPMVVYRERDGDFDFRRGEMLEEEKGISQQQEIDLVHESVSLIEYVARLRDFRSTQRQECYSLVRPMKSLLPFFDEIRLLGACIPPRGVVTLSRLKKVLCLAKKLLTTCSDGSKIFLALETEAMMVKFHVVYENLCQVLDEMPFDEIDVSVEVKEQVELMVTQLRRSKRRKHTQDMELAVDLMVAFSKTDERKADIAIIERLAKKLDLHTVEYLKKETIAIRKLAEERGRTSECVVQIIEILNKFKRILGMEVTNIFEEPVKPKMLERSESLVIPHEFLCPITLEVMRDPVIIASGQTFERESILKWFDSNNRTCPKTRETLAHLSVAPNHALKNLITQWREKNNYKHPSTEDLESSQGSSIKEEEITSLVEELSSTELEVLLRAVKDIRMLSKENTESRVLFANCGAIPLLVRLLPYPNHKIQEHAVTSLLNLSINDTNKKLIAQEQAIPAIIDVLRNGSMESRENSAAALFSLSMLDENKVTIALSEGIPALVELLETGTVRGKKDALTALFNLCLNQANKARAIDAGIVPPLQLLLKDKRTGMLDEALSMFLLLATHPQGRHEIGELSFIGMLVDIIREGTPKNKECAASVLLELSLNNSSHILAALQFGVYEHLVEMSLTGTNRAKRKANAILQLMRTSDQLP